MDIFSRFGVAEYWIADPIANTLEICVNGAGKFVRAGVYDQGRLVSSPTLPGLHVSAARIFEE